MVTVSTARANHRSTALEGRLPVQEQCLGGEAGDRGFGLHLLIIERQTGARVDVPDESKNDVRVVRDRDRRWQAGVPAVAVEFVDASDDAEWTPVCRIRDLQWTHDREAGHEVAGAIEHGPRGGNATLDLLYALRELRAALQPPIAEPDEYTATILLQATADGIRWRGERASRGADLIERGDGEGAKEAGIIPERRERDAQSEVLEPIGLAGGIVRAVRDHRIHLTVTLRKRHETAHANVRGRVEPVQFLRGTAEPSRPEVLDVIDDDRLNHPDAADGAQPAHAEEILREIVLEVAVLEPHGPAAVVRGRRLLEDVRRDANAAAFPGGHAEGEVRATDIEAARRQATASRFRRGIGAPLEVAEQPP